MLDRQSDLSEGTSEFVLSCTIRSAAIAATTWAQLASNGAELIGQAMPRVVDSKLRRFRLAAVQVFLLTG